MTEVLIYQESKSLMQSGSSKSQKWFMKFTNYKSNEEQYIFNLMNWVGGFDTLKTIKIPFKSKEDAINFATNNNFEYKITESEKRKVVPKSYTANFID